MSGYAPELRRLMTDRGTGVRELARQVPCSPAYISQLRNGSRAPSPQIAARIDKLLGCKGKLAALAAAEPGEESGARVPLWQVPDSTDDVNPVEHLTRFRAVLTDHDNLFGPRSLIPVVRDHLVLIRELRQGRAGTDGRDLLILQARYAETLAWLCQDSADFPAAQYWLDRALEWAHMAGDMQWAAFVLARKSQLAGDMQDPASAVDLADAAARLAGTGTRLRAASAAYQAHGLALAGNHEACERTLDEAEEIASSPEEEPAAPWAGWLSEGYVQTQRARCLDILGEHGAAIPLFEQAITGIPPSLRRDRGVYLAREAVARAGAGDPDGAAGTGIQAVAIARSTQSGRIVTELRRLDASMRRWKASSAAGEFREALASVIPLQARAAGRGRTP